MRKYPLISAIPLTLFIAICGVETGCGGSSAGTDNGDNGGDYLGPEIVDPGVHGSVPGIAVDGSNNSHVIFYETDNLDIKYASRSEGVWQSETVDSDGDMGDGHDIAVDQNGRPHISYRDKTNGSVKYATKVEGSWQKTVIDPAEGEGESVESSSIAIDSNGNPQIAYNIQSTSESSYIKYAAYDGSSWSTEEIGIEGHWPSLALDTNDYPHIAFHNPNDYHVYYSRRLESGDWSSPEEVDSSATVTTDPRLALDSNNNPGIVYRDDTGEGFIKYAVWDGTSWSTQNVASNVGAEADEQDFAINGNDEPYIVYGAPNIGGLILAKANEAGEWTFTTVDNAGVCAIAIDSLNRAHIAYTYTSDGNDDGGNGGADDGNGVGETSVDGDVSEGGEIIKYARVE